MSIVRRRIEKKIGQPVTAKMDFVGYSGRKNQPHRIHIAGSGMAAQIAHNYFRLVPGKNVSVKRIVRLDMMGLDPFTKPEVGRAGLI